jgi:hypothetical protein
MTTAILPIAVDTGIKPKERLLSGIKVSTPIDPLPRVLEPTRQKITSTLGFAPGATVECLIPRRDVGNGGATVCHTPIPFDESGVSIVRINRGFGNPKQKLEVKYDRASLPNLNEVPRSEIKLPGINTEKIEKAKAISEQVKFMWTEARLSPEYVEMDKFEDIAQKAYANVRKTGDAETLNSDQELFTLTAYFSLKNNSFNKKGLLSKFPNGLLNANSPHLEERLKTLGRLFYINIKKKDTPILLENYEGAVDDLVKAGLDCLLQIERPELCKISFPGYLEGENPIVREWSMYYMAKWSGECDDEELLLRKLLAVRAAKWFLKYGADAVNEVGEYRIDKIKDRAFAPFVYNKKSGLRGLIERHPELGGLVNFLRFAEPNLVGIGNNRVNPWSYKHHGTWEGFEVLDQLSEHVIAGNFSYDGEIDVEKRSEVFGLAGYYERVASNALKGRGSLKAVSHKYPDLIGLRPNQFHIWEISHAGIRIGKYGEDLSRLEMAVKLHDAGLGELDLSGPSPIFGFTKAQFVKWCDDPEGNNGKGLKSFFVKNTGTWFHCNLGSNVKTALEFLLGQKVANGLTGKEMISEMKKNKFEIVLNNPFKQELFTSEEVSSEVAKPVDSTYDSKQFSTEYSPGVLSALTPFSSVENLFTLYKLTDALVVSSSDTNEGSNLEKILNAQNAETSNYILSNDDIRDILKIIKTNSEYLFPGEANDALRDDLRITIESVLATQKNPRDVLLEAIKIKSDGQAPEALTRLKLLDHSFSYFAAQACMKGMHNKLRSGSPSLLHSGIRFEKIAEIEEQAERTAEVIRGNWEKIYAKYKNMDYGDTIDRFSKIAQSSSRTDLEQLELQHLKTRIVKTKFDNQTNESVKFTDVQYTAETFKTDLAFALRESQQIPNGLEAIVVAKLAKSNISNPFVQGIPEDYLTVGSKEFSSRVSALWRYAMGS